jgi:hypothetical protein
VREASYRLYSCQRCGVSVQICRRCDHGQRYCAGACSTLSRRESQRRASARYQRTRGGATRHAARQRSWRGRHAHKVTHQGSPTAACVGNVLVAASPPEPTDADTLDRALWIRPEPVATIPRCHFCGTPLPPRARVRSRWDWPLY